MGEQEWAGVEQALTDLQARVDPVLWPVLDDLRTIVAAEPKILPPEAIRALGTRTSEISEHLRKGTSVAEIIESAKSGGFRFDQPNWHPQVVNNTERIFKDCLVMLSERGPAAVAPPPVSMPVVVLAMTDAEVTELVDGSAFADYPPSLRTDFEQLQALLDAEGISMWRTHYHSDARHWTPFGIDGPTVEELVTGVIENANRHLGCKPPLAAKFVELSTLSDDRWELRRLREDGCLMIMDSISMRHPRIQHAFHHSLLDAYPKTYVVAIAPVPKAFETARQLTIILTVRLADYEFSKRRVDPEEFGACIEASERWQFDQWAHNRVKLLASSLGVTTGIRSYMRITP